MTAKMARVLMVLFCLAAAAASALLYPSLPDRVPFHWNASGTVDGWASRPLGAAFVPGLILAVILLTWILQWLSPKSFRVETFRETYYYVMVVLVAMFALIHGVMLTAALRPGWDSGRWLVGVMCIFLGLLGNVLGRVRRNFWMGVRTPWTLASEAVWDVTHRLAARMVVAGGILGGVVVLCGGPPFVALVLVVAGLALPAFWSLVYYKRFEAAGRL
jgi:uncharacterized membrane protein